MKMILWHIRGFIQGLLAPAVYVCLFMFFSFDYTPSIVHVGHDLVSMTTVFGMTPDQIERPKLNFGVISDIFSTGFFWSFISVFFICSLYVWYYVSFDYHRKYRRILMDARGILHFGNIFSNVGMNIYDNEDWKYGAEFGDAIKILEMKILDETMRIRRVELSLTLIWLCLIFVMFLFSFDAIIRQYIQHLIS